MTIKLNSRKIVFFILAYYLCLSPMMYLISHHYTGDVQTINPFKFVVSKIFPGLPFLYNAIYLEQIVFFLTFILITTRTINTGKYLNFHSKRAFLLFILFFLIINLSFFDVGLIFFSQYYSSSTILICNSFIFILLGLNIHVIENIFLVQKMRVLFYTIVASYVALLVVSIFLAPNSEMYSWYLRGISKETLFKTAMFDYNYIADTVALLLLLVISQVKSMTRKVLIFFFGLFTLTLIGSRTSFICFGLAGILFWVLMLIKVSKKTLLLPVALLVLLIVSTFIYSAFIAERVTEQYGDLSLNPSGSYRFSFSKYKSDGSYILRGEIFDQRWNDLKDKWLVGRFMSETVEGRKGTYFHNWFSFWSSFGIVPFFLSVILIISSLNRSARQFLKDTGSPTNQLLLFWSVYIVIAITFSRAYNFPYIWFVLFGASMIDRKFS